MDAAAGGGDPGRLRQVLINLVGNAVKFTEEGTVRVTVRHASGGGSGIPLRFEIEDTGIGIPHAKREHIFGSFNQVDGSMTRRFGGTGLGLAITSGLVLMMGGVIDVDSREGEGSTVFFTAHFQEAEDARSPRSGAADLSGLRVLVVDDHAANRTIFARFGERMGMEVSGASSAEEALALLDRAHREGAPIQLALLDIQMPEMDGVEATRRIREREAREGGFSPMVAMTAHAMVGDREWFLAAGMDDYVTKPISRDRLRSLLRGIGRTPADEPQPEPRIPDDKGQANSFGAEPARARAVKLEILGRDGDLDSARELHGELQRWVLRLEDDLKRPSDELAG